MIGMMRLNMNGEIGRGRCLFQPLRRRRIQAFLCVTTLPLDFGSTEQVKQGHPGRCRDCRGLDSRVQRRRWFRIFDVLRRSYSKASFPGTSISEARGRRSQRPLDLLVGDAVFRREVRGCLMQVHGGKGSVRPPWLTRRHSLAGSVPQWLTFRVSCVPCNQPLRVD